MSPETDAPATENNPTRRRILLRLSWTGFAIFLSTFFGSVLGFIWPRVSSRKARVFQVGHPDDQRPGGIVYHRGSKLFILRDEKGFLALSAVCTHLGCLVVWNRDHSMFLCPCHGGKFDKEGNNVEGPPPRPLELFSLSLDEDGYLVVNQDLIVKRDDGPAPRYLPV